MPILNIKVNYYILTIKGTGTLSVCKLVFMIF